ncbi:MAG TPA: SDR family oxidoreductase [Stackebrandtia sp.]|jgi:NAD(P)-dependent dehydrogenase (short-subunit alcohol dehydrogenase family)/pimeloyl-ACP methyl ester carboxylesterase|uniref:SDR family oxidoreductase n=1 Tax=Stackebrandtia sp. TaxID=2023065 RepID=UPI002D2DBD9F|nr:SDR family oxidoreductase [Stackebrandtia sp.]HZE40658.1 SDR family oxidoreductase [Stackebrandtia sp.]
MRHTTVTSRGVELAVFEWGDPEADTVLLVHGYPDTHAVWNRVAEILAERFHVVAYDVRGAGESGVPNGRRGWRLDALAADAWAVAGAVSPERPVHLVGHDWGSIQSWEAVTRPGAESRFASFTSISGPSLDHMGHWIRHRLARPTPRHLAQLGRQQARSWYIAAFHVPVLSTMVWRRFARGWEKLLRRNEGVAVDGHPAPTVYQDGLRGMRLYRANMLPRMLRPRSRFTAVPVQVVCPTRDAYVGPGLSRGISRWVPRLWRREIDAPHWVPLTDPGRLSAMIGEFIGHVGAERSPALEEHRVRPRAKGRKAKRLDGRLAVVTGAGSGIGRATALALAAEGCRVIAADLHADAVRLTSDMSVDPRRTHPFEVDVSDADAMRAFAKSVAADHGVPDVLVNNAGVGHSGPFLDTTGEDWRRVLDVNLWGVIHGCKEFAPLMAGRGSGQIVNVASAAAFAPSKVLPVYATSKAAVLMLSQCLRAELAADRVGVSAVCPGFINTNITRATTFAGLDAAAQDAKRDRVTGMYSRRGYGPEKVARAILSAARRDRAVVPVTVEARAFRWTSGLLPAVMRAIAKVDPS